MKPFHRNTLFAAFASFAALALTACGGGGGGTTASTTPTATTPTALASITGVAADGYLSGAKACLDLNNNKVCDANEPSANTDSTGAFTIKSVTPADKSKYSVVVMVGPTTIDSDTQKAVGKGYTLTSPPGKSAFISPVTTMINTQMEKDGSSATDAEKVVKQNMGFTQNSKINLFRNYVKESKSTSNPLKNDFVKIHKIARITATILGDNQDKIKAAANSSGVNVAKFTAEIVNLVVQKVLSQLQAIVKVATDKKDSTAFTKTELGSLATPISTTKISHHLTKLKDTSINPDQTGPTFDIKTLMTTGGGITGFQAYRGACTTAPCPFKFTANNIKMKASSAVPPVVTLLDTQRTYNKTTSAWNSNPAAASHKSYIVTKKGWVLNNEGTSTITINKNSVVENLVGGITQAHQFVRAINLSGMLLQNFLGESGDNNQSIGEENLSSATVAFSKGALAFKFATVTQSDLYTSDLDNEQGKCWNPTITYVDSSTNCNSINVSHVSTTGKVTHLTATALSSLFATSANDLTLIPLRKNELQLIRTTSTNTSGVANIYRVSPSTSPVLIKTTTWVEKTVNAIKMIVVKMPGDLQERVGYDRGPDALFFAVQGNYVRLGIHISAGTFILDRNFMFNKIATSDITKNFIVKVDK